MTAKVLWFNDSKGFGFAETPDGRKVFCHWSQIKVQGFKSLTMNQNIRFDLYENDKGLEAKNIEVEE
jgi:CspA family cold shock protein